MFNWNTFWCCSERRLLSLASVECCRLVGPVTSMSLCFCFLILSGQTFLFYLCISPIIFHQSKRNRLFWPFIMLGHVIFKKAKNHFLRSASLESPLFCLWCTGQTLKNVEEKNNSIDEQTRKYYSRRERVNIPSWDEWAGRLVFRFDFHCHPVWCFVVSCLLIVPHIWASFVIFLLHMLGYKECHHVVGEILPPLSSS